MLPTDRFCRFEAASPSGEAPYMEGVPHRQRLFSRNLRRHGIPRLCRRFRASGGKESGDLASNRDSLAPPL